MDINMLFKLLAGILLSTCVVLSTAGQPAQEECYLPADTGPCDGACMRWFYDAYDLLCREFSYGCCEGNDNNFETEKQCMDSCRGADMCLLPRDKGPCEGLCTMWYYEPRVERCLQFDWGCCEGNGNRFETEEQCEDICGGRKII